MAIENVGILFTAKDVSWDKGFKRAAGAVQRFSKNVDANFSQVKKNMASLAKEANKLGSNIKNSFNGVQAALATIGGTVAIAKPIAEAKKFELQLANVNTLLDGTGVSIGRYRDQLLSLAKESPKTLGDLSAALYQTISAGIPAIEGAGGAFDVLTQAQKAAVAGLSSTEQAVDAFATVLNAYGTENVSAAEAGDKLLKVVQSGRITFPELAQNLGTVATVAAKAGVSIDELSSLFITLTRAGLKAPQAATGIRALISQIQKPSKETTELVAKLNETLDENSQIQLGAKALREVGFTGVLESLTKATGGSSEALSKIFPNIRALTPALITVGKGFSDFTRFTADSVGAVGTLDVAFQKVDGTFSNTFEKFKSTVNATLVNAGNTVLPNLNKRFQELISYVDANGDKFVKTFESFAVAIINLGEFFLKYGDIILKVLGALFGGKAIGLFARSIVALGPILIAFRNVAVSTFATVTGSANAAAAAAQTAATQTAAAGATAASGFGSKLMGGLKTLGKNAGLIGLAIGIGTMLAEAAGKAFGNFIRKMRGEGEEELDRLLKDQQRRVADIRAQGAAIGGFESPAEQDAAELDVATGRKLEIVPGFGTAQTEELEMAVDTVISRAQTIADERVSSGLTLSFLKGEVALPEVDMTKAVDYEKMFELFAKVRTEAGEVAGKQIAMAGSLIDSDATKEDIATLQRLAKEAKNIKELQKLAGEAGPGVLAVLDSVRKQVEISDVAVEQAEKRAQIEAQVIQESVATRKSQIVDLNDFIATQTKLRVAKGVAEEEAAIQAKLLAENLLQSNLIAADQDRLELTKEINGQIAEYNQLGEQIKSTQADTTKSASERNRLANDLIEKQRVLAMLIDNAKTNLRTGALARIRNLKTMQKELALEGDINRERQKRVQEQLEADRQAKKSADAEKRRQKGAAAYRKAQGERAKFAKLLQKLEQDSLKSDVKKLKTAEAQLQLDNTDLEIAKQRLASNGGIEKNAEAIAENIKAQTKNAEALLKVRRELAKAEQAAAVNSEKNARAEAERAAKASGRFTGRGRSGQKRRADAAKKTQAAIDKIATQSQKNLDDLETQRAQKVQQANAANAQTQLQLQQELKNLEKARQDGAKKAVEDQAKSAREGVEKAAEAFTDSIKGIEGALDDFNRIVEVTGVDADKYAAALYERFKDLEEIDGPFGASIDDQISGMLQATRGLAELDDLLGLKGGASLQNLKGAFAAGGDSLSRSLLNVLEEGGSILAESLGEFGSSFIDGFGSALADGSQEFAAGAIGLDFERAGFAISDQITGGFRKGSAFFDKAGDASAAAIQGAMKASFGEGGEILAKGLTIATDSFFSGLAALLDGAAALFENIVGPVFGALQRPIDAIFGGFESAIDSIFDAGKSEEKIAKEQERLARERAKFAEERAALVDENEAQLRAMRDAGASNEEIARAQAALAKDLETFDEGAPTASETEEQGDPIQKAFDDAMAFVVSLIQNLPRIVQQFLSALAEGLPTIISGLMTALADTLVVIANNFGDILLGVLTGLMDGLPKLIDGLIDAVPKLLQGVFRAATYLVQQLPFIVNELLRFVIEVIPELVQVIAEELPKLIVAILEMIPELIDGILVAIPVIIQEVVDAIPVIIDGLVEALPDIIQALIEAAPKIIVSLVKAVPQIIYAVIRGVPDIIWSLIQAVPEVVGALLSGIAGGLEYVFRPLAIAFEYTIAFFTDLPGYLAAGVTYAFQAVADFLGGFLGQLYDFGGYLYDSIASVFSYVGDSILYIFTGAGDFIYNSIASGFNWVIDGFRYILDWFRRLIEWFGNIVSFLNDIFTWLARALDSVINGVSNAAQSAWDWLTDWHTGGMVSQSDSNPGLAGVLQALGSPQFQEGGMVVRTPGDNFRRKVLGLPMIADDVPALLQAGEAVLNRDATSRLGEDMINALNAGGSIGQPVSVNVGITPNEGGVGGLAAALLPLLMGAVNVSVASGDRVERSTRLIGYKPIKGA